MILNIQIIKLLFYYYVVYGVRTVNKASEVAVEDPNERHLLPLYRFAKLFPSSKQYDTRFRVQTRPNSSKRDA